MAQDNSLPDASFISLGSTYHGIFRLPHGRWRTLTGTGGKPLVFSDAVSATRAAMAKMNAMLFKPIVAERMVDDPVAQKLAAELIEFKGRREDDRRRDRKIFRKGGKPAVIVETRRRAR